MNECEWMCLLNEEPVSGTICLTEATIDDEIVSEKRSTRVCPAPRPLPRLKQAHTYQTMYGGSILSYFSSLIRENLYRWEINVKPTVFRDFHPFPGVRKLAIISSRGGGGV